MKTQWTLVLFILCAFAVAEGFRFLRAESVNPSQNTAPQNPSQTTAPQNPSRTTPPQNPSQAAPLPNPSQALPRQEPPRIPGATPAPRDEPAVRRITGRQLAFEVRSAILMSGAAVEGLRVKPLAGKVVLSGVVRSEEEKARVGARAAGVAGEQNVVNELLVR